MMSWTVCQIGARENYAVARALAREGLLGHLLTDIWSNDARMLGVVSKRLAGRFHPELKNSQVKTPSTFALLQEVKNRLVSRDMQEQVVRTNAWFQKFAAGQISASTENSGTVFAYSYAAADIFAAAKAKGWHTVLGQTNPGPVEARMVESLYEKSAHYGGFKPYSNSYWDSWRRETELADQIIVNSEWSRKALLLEGVPKRKIRVVPLAFESSFDTSVKSKISTFDHERPLRLLFLGGVTLRKGIDLVFESFLRLPNLPLHLDVVGEIMIDVPEAVCADKRINFHGAIPRAEVGNFYRTADVFLFPTRSDGFGLTQLEALSAGLPVIASDRCAAVVDDGQNGRVLDDVSVDALMEVLSDLVADPAKVWSWTANARLDPKYSIESLGARMKKVDQYLSRRGTK